jgi:hypothetical protein
MSASGGKIYLRNRADIDFNKVGLIFIHSTHFHRLVTPSFSRHISLFLVKSNLNKFV